MIGRTLLARCYPLMDRSAPHTAEASPADCLLVAHGVVHAADVAVVVHAAVLLLLQVLRTLTSSAVAWLGVT